MKHKVERLAKQITGVISSWDAVDCVLSCEASEADEFDPYFTLVLDVYYSGAIPESDARMAAFGNPGAFETSGRKEKDRFFLEELPVHIEYKSMDEIERSLGMSGSLASDSAELGTYLFYRVSTGNILFKRTARLERVRETLMNLPDASWSALRETYRAKIEHHLSDLGGSALKEDLFFFCISIAGFMRSCASYLFAVNKVFEPSDRFMTDALKTLKILPADFIGRWNMLLRTDGATNPERKFELAQHFAKDLIFIA